MLVGLGEVASRKNHFVLPGYILDAIPVFSAFPFSFKPHPAFPLPKGVVKFKRLGVTLQQEWSLMYYLPRERVTVCEDTFIRTVSLSRPTNLKSNQIAVLKTVLFFSFFIYFARMPETFSTSSALNPRLIYNVESVCVNPSSPMNFLLTIWNCFDPLQILSPNFKRKCMDSSRENLYVDIGA